MRLCGPRARSVVHRPGRVGQARHHRAPTSQCERARRRWRRGSARIGGRSWPDLCEQARPHAPRQQDQRLGVIAAKEEQIVFAEPAFELHEAAAVPARLAFGNERRCFTAERIDVEVVAAATKPARTGERIAFGMNADSAVRVDDLALNAIALPAMASTAHGSPRISASASLARVKFTMSENVPSVRFSRYMPGNAVSGTMAT